MAADPLAPFSFLFLPGHLRLQTLRRGFRRTERRRVPICPLSSPQALKDLKGRTEAIPCVVGDEEVWTSDVQYQVSVSPVGGLGSASVNLGSVSWAAHKHALWGLCLQRSL